MSLPPRYAIEVTALSDDDDHTALVELTLDGEVWRLRATQARELGAYLVAAADTARLGARLARYLRTTLDLSPDAITEMLHEVYAVVRKQ